MLWRGMYPDLSPEESAHTVSFDVFDTLITRPWFRPVDQFAAIGPQLRQLGLFAGTDLEWMLLRHGAEVEARRHAFVEEVTAADIYAVIAERLGWDEMSSAQAYQVEFQRELRDIRPIMRAAKRMDRVRNAGKGVIVTSDTYFSAAELNLLLRRCGYDLKADCIYASSDHRLKKGSGRLFSIILHERKLDSSQLCHIGDQPVPDGRAPANLGIRSAICNAFVPNRYERMLAQSDDDHLVMCSAVAGGARASRLARHFEDWHAQTIWNVCCDVAGPLLFAYVLWILSRSRAQGIDRLYFLARDGQILLKVAHKLCPWLGWNIECRYLYASRQSFAFPAIVEVDNTTLRWIVDPGETPTIDTVLKRVALTSEDVEPELAEAGFFPESRNLRLQQDDIRRLIDILKQPRVSQRILANAKERRTILADYLRQQGLGDGTRWAICDLGWRGLIQRSLDQTISPHPEFPKNYKGFYFGLNVEQLLAERERTEAFESGNMSWVAWIMDMFCAAEHPSVRGFARDSNGTVSPLFDEEDQFQSRWHIDLQQAAIMHFVNELTQTLSASCISVDDFLNIVRPRAMRALKLMLKHPSEEEAEVFGGRELPVGATHDSQAAIAPRLRPGQLMRWLVLRNRRGGLPWIYWPEASIRRSARPKFLRMVLSALDKARSLVARIKA